MSILEELNGHACCLLQLCCPPAAQRKAILVEARKAYGKDATAEDAIQWVIDNLAIVAKVEGSILKAGFDMGVAHAKSKAT